MNLSCLFSAQLKYFFVIAGLLCMLRCDWSRNKTDSNRGTMSLSLFLILLLLSLKHSEKLFLRLLKITSRCEWHVQGRDMFCRVSCNYFWELNYFHEDETWVIADWPSLVSFLDISKGRTHTRINGENFPQWVMAACKLRTLTLHLNNKGFGDTLQGKM